MNSHMAGRATSNSAGKPSLYTDTNTMLHLAEAQGDSILGGLEYSRPNRKRLITVLGIAVVSAIAVGWWQAGGLVRKKDAVPVVLAAAPQAHADSAAAISPNGQIIQSSTGEVTSSSNDPAEQTPAIVISESENADGVSSAFPQDASDVKPAASLQVTDSGEKGSAHATNTDETKVQIPVHAATVSRDAPTLTQETKAKAVQSAASHDRPKQKAPALADVQIAMKSPTNAKAKDGVTSVSKSSGNSGNGEAKAKHAGKDGDVELIAALLNRVSARSEPVSEDAVRKPVTGRGPSRLSSGDQKKSKKAGAARESVLPTSASAEIQLKQCGTMSLLESELCRFKVCDGRWGRDPACPEYSHTSAALP